MIKNNSTMRFGQTAAVFAMMAFVVSGQAQFPGFGGGGNTASRSGSTSTRQYNSAGTVGSAVVSVDPETRQVIVITDAETYTNISQVISNLDQPKPQVLIKVVFLEVTYNNGHDIGIEGGFTKGAGADRVVSGANSFGASGVASAATNLQFNSFGIPTTSFGTTPPGAGVYQILTTDYQATLRAIATAGKTEVLSRPSILARNNQPATITVGQSVPLISNTRFDAVNGQINSITYNNVGIILRVTPFISSEGLVEMIVSPEISSLADQSQWVSIGGGALAPVVNTRSADTVVVTPNGQPVIIGGLIQNTKLANDSKVPILGDIPLLGNLFKRQAKNNTKTELLIFLTPHIIMSPSQLAAMTETERGKAPLSEKAFGEQELNRFIDDLPVKKPETKKNSGKKVY